MVSCIRLEKGNIYLNTILQLDIIDTVINIELEMMMFVNYVVL